MNATHQLFHIKAKLEVDSVHHGAGWKGTTASSLQA